MTGKEILDILMGRLGRDSPEFRAKTLLEMKLAQEDRLEKRATLPHWLITERADTVTEIGEPRLFLPSDFIREVEDMNLMLVEEDGNELDLGKRGWDEALVEYDDADTGEPAIYTMRGNYVHLRPTPDAVYTIRFPGYYARQPAPIDDASFTNAWLTHASSLIIGLTGMVMAGLYLKDPELVAAFGITAKDANKELDDAITAFEEANRERRMG